LKNRLQCIYSGNCVNKFNTRQAGGREANDEIDCRC